MTLDGAFFIFGWFYVIFGSALVLLPWLRGREDLFTSKNLFMAGTVNFVGVASISTGSSGFYIVQPEAGDFLRIVFGVGLLLVAFYTTYHFWQYPRRLADRVALLMPDTSGSAVLVLSVLGACIAVLGRTQLLAIPLLGHLLAGFSVPISTICFGVVFWKWWNAKHNGFFLLLAILMGLIMMVIAMTAGTSRRPLLGLFTTMLIVMYWSNLRYRSPLRALGGLVLPVAAASVIISGYSVIRHQILNPHERNPIEVFTDRLFSMTSAIREGEATGSIIEGESTISCTLACIDQYSRNGSPNWFHTFRFVFSNPVPRVWWPEGVLGEKPVALGEVLPRDLGEWETGYINWGVGIVGHAYYDGGVWVVIIYGVILGFFFRYYDDKMSHQPENGFILGTLGAMSSNIITFSRGDIATFAVDILACMVAGWLLMRVSRFIWGTVVLEPVDEEADPYDIEQESLPVAGVPQT
ncbi:MAG: hypothetical protein KF724_09065 [Phycisphaeraceae bacterium]|nr:hypothetical protein [Phycisphaeraceae bacterium]